MAIWIEATLIEGKGGLKISSGDLKAADIEDALNAGGDILKDAAANIVQTQAKWHRRGGKLVRAVHTEIGGAGTDSVVKLGWKKIGIGATSKYVDSSGRSRSVSTTADYGGILEYSARRQLRHMGPAYEQNEEAATAAIEASIDGAIDRILK